MNQFRVCCNTAPLFPFDISCVKMPFHSISNKSVHKDLKTILINSHIYSHLGDENKIKHYADKIG